MSQWVDRILSEFPADLARLWIVADPDDVLLDEQVLSGLRERGFEMQPFEDSIVFRAEFEERYRSAWDRGEPGPSRALILHLRGTQVDELPWDYRRQARRVSLSLSNLFSKLNHTVVRQLGSEMWRALFEAQAEHAHQSLGENATKEFVLTHIFRISPHLITRPEDLWRELLRIHYRELALPPVLAHHISQVVGKRAILKRLPVADLFIQKSLALRVVQDAWYRHLTKLGIVGSRVSEPAPPDYVAAIDIPFEHPDVRSYVDSMFLDGTLHPLLVQSVPAAIPDWAKVGLILDPASLLNLVVDGIKALMAELPTLDALHRDWSHFARRLGEVISRFHALDAAQAHGIKDSVLALQSSADERLREWVAKHYANLPSLPAAKSPVMVHHVPRFLSMKRSAGEPKVALLVFDGLAVDQWIQIRENLTRHSQRLVFDEGACFAWLPTLTSVSRQALFSGLRPREFADSIETTSQEPALWSRFWLEHGLKANEVLYRKSIKRNEDLPELEALLSQPAVKVAGLVIDTVDEIVHGAVLGKRGIAKQIDDWCDSGFVNKLMDLLLERDFRVYVTADHGNVEAVGSGRPNQGMAPETRGERVRTYRSDALIAEALAVSPQSYRLDIAGLPSGFMPLFAGGRSAFVPAGSQVVVHGGVSVEELIVPFVKVSYLS